MLNGLRIEHLGDIISKAQSWLVLNLPVFMFVYIDFNVAPTRITDLVRNVSDELQGRRSWSDHSDLGRTKNLDIYGQSLVISVFRSDQ